MYFRFSLLLFLILIGSGYAQEGDLHLTIEERTEALHKIQRLLTENYVFADTAAKCVEFLQKQIESGAYDDLSHPRAFVHQINTDLSKIHHDPHLRLTFVLPEAQRFEDKQPDLALLTRSLDRRMDNYGIRDVRILPGNIGYLNLSSFEPLEISKSGLVAALHLLQNTSAMIIDLRQNVGGNLSTVQFICSFFMEPPKLLFSYYWRRGDYIENYSILENIPGRRRPHVPLFILTGPQTFSAAEEFSYSMRIQNRALIIGERTGGGANPGYVFDISSRFSIFIPTGRAINPITGTNWEGKGVTPDIRVDQDLALNTALDRAGPAARTYQNEADNESSGQLIVLTNLLTRLRSDSSVQVLSSLDSVLDRLRGKDLIEEWTINELAYRYLNQKFYTIALALFSYNTSRFPDSANAFDSLAEGYYRMHDSINARKNYEHSLLLDPNNQNADYMLKKLEKEP
jgi:tetratricopeptide (TPR) repeat protein